MTPGKRWGENEGVVCIDGPESGRVAVPYWNGSILYRTRAGVYRLEQVGDGWAYVWAAEPAEPCEVTVERARFRCSGCKTYTEAIDPGCNGRCGDATGATCRALRCPGCGRLHHWGGSFAKPENPNPWDPCDAVGPDDVVYRVAFAVLMFHRGSVAQARVDWDRSSGIRSRYRLYAENILGRAGVAVSSPSGLV